MLTHPPLQARVAATINVVKAYFLLYQKAKKLYDEKKVFLTTVKEEDKKNIFIFTCNGHETNLTITKIPNTKLWLRSWGCSCEHFSLWQDKSECKHIIACTYYLINGGYNDRTKE